MAYGRCTRCVVGALACSDGMAPPADADDATGPPIEDSASTPTAMRAATWSKTDAP